MKAYMTSDEEGTISFWYSDRSAVLLSVLFFIIFIAISAFFSSDLRISEGASNTSESNTLSDTSDSILTIITTLLQLTGTILSVVISVSLIVIQLAGSLITPWVSDLYLEKVNAKRYLGISLFSILFNVIILFVGYILYPQVKTIHTYLFHIFIILGITLLFYCLLALIPFSVKINSLINPRYIARAIVAGVGDPRSESNGLQDIFDMLNIGIRQFNDNTIDAVRKEIPKIYPLFHTKEGSHLYRGFRERMELSFYRSCDKGYLNGSSSIIQILHAMTLYFFETKDKDKESSISSPFNSNKQIGGKNREYFITGSIISITDCLLYLNHSSTSTKQLKIMSEGIKAIRQSGNWAVNSDSPVVFFECINKLLILCNRTVKSHDVFSFHKSVLALESVYKDIPSREKKRYYHDEISIEIGNIVISVFNQDNYQEYDGSCYLLIRILLSFLDFKRPLNDQVIMACSTGIFSSIRKNPEKMNKVQSILTEVLDDFISNGSDDSGKLIIILLDQLNSLFMIQDYKNQKYGIIMRRNIEKCVEADLWKTVYVSLVSLLKSNGISGNHTILARNYVRAHIKHGIFLEECRKMEETCSDLVSKMYERDPQAVYNWVFDLNRLIFSNDLD